MIDHEFTIDGLRLERDRLLADNKALREALELLETAARRYAANIDNSAAYVAKMCERARAALAKTRHD